MRMNALTKNNFTFIIFLTSNLVRTGFCKFKTNLQNLKFLRTLAIQNKRGHWWAGNSYIKPMGGEIFWSEKSHD